MWALMILTLFSLSISFGVQQRAALLSRLQTLDALYPLAYSGVELGKSYIKDDGDKELDTSADSWSVGVPPEIALKNGVLKIGDGLKNGLVDEGSKINLNKTKPEILSRLLQQVAGLAKDDSEELAYCLIDWMDSDSFFGHPDYGAEDSAYESLEKPYSAKDMPYELLDETLLVSGMTTNIFEAIKPYVTVYGEGAVNLNTATQPVYLALGFDAKTAEDIARYLKGDDGLRGTGDDRFFSSLATVAEDMDKKAGTPLDGTQKSILDGLISGGSVGLNSAFFSAHITATLDKNKVSVVLDAVIDRKGKVKLARSSGVLWPAR